MEITIRINGEPKTFTKTHFALREMTVAMKYLRDNEMAESEMVGYGTDEQIERRITNEAKAMVDIFDNQFTIDEFLNGFKSVDRQKIDEAIVLSLGNHEEVEEKKEQSTLSAKPTNSWKSSLKAWLTKDTK